MKKRLFLSAAVLALGTVLTACGSSDVEQLKQTGIMTDYSSMVTLGTYKGLEVTVDAVEVTDEDVSVLIDDILFNYYSLSSQDGNTDYVWDDATAALISDGKYTTTKAYEDYRRQGMLEERKREQEQAYIDGVWEKVLESCTFTSIDEAEIKASAEEYYLQQKQNYVYYAGYYGYSYEEYLMEKQGMTDEEFHDKCYDYVLLERKRVMASSAIFFTEKMTLTDAEFSEGVAKLLETYSGYESSAEFVETFGEDYVREYLVAKKVDDYLKSVNNMTEK